MKLVCFHEIAGRLEVDRGTVRRAIHRDRDAPAPVASRRHCPEHDYTLIPGENLYDWDKVKEWAHRHYRWDLGIDAPTPQAKRRGRRPQPVA